MMLVRFKQRYDLALAQEDKLMSLRAELIKLRSEGIDKETLKSDLMLYYQQLETEPEQDIIADAADFLYGWCSPHMRID